MTAGVQLRGEGTMPAPTTALHHDGGEESCVWTS